MSEIKKPKKVKFVYYTPEDYKIYPVNGAWGGPTARNDIIVNFFVERQEMPREEVHSIGENGSLGPIEKEQKEEVQIARELQVGIVLNPDQALDIAEWLKKNVDQLRRLQKGELKAPKESTGEPQDE